MSTTSSRSQHTYSQYSFGSASSQWRLNLRVLQLQQLFCTHWLKFRWTLYSNDKTQKYINKRKHLYKYIHCWVIIVRRGTTSNLTTMYVSFLTSFLYIFIILTVSPHSASEIPISTRVTESYLSSQHVPLHTRYKIPSFDSRIFSLLQQSIQ
ncbi:Hypothetical_protein [Hexamita inflata]|uniref:Hypothetical_protein n=1 Tax=Hexamita inflata TaxID=28002 RepID=A0AA86TVE7_9EUKA|nr:Hypothetical protein HINF_LOCUS17701 [Hexamita inflata]